MFLTGGLAPVRALPLSMQSVYCGHGDRRAVLWSEKIMVGCVLEFFRTQGAFQSGQVGILKLLQCFEPIK